MTQTTIRPDKKRRAALPLPEVLLRDVPAQGRGVTAALAGAATLLAAGVAAAIAGGVTGLPQLPLLVTPVVAGGLVVCLGAALVFVFRRQAAVESVEMEELERGGEAQRSIFRDLADARPAAGRVRSAYKFLLPAVSVLALSAMFGLGIPAALRAVNDLRAEAALSAQARPAAAAAAAAVFAFACFLVGRWIAGLARDEALRLLRGAGGFLVGTGVLLLLAAVALGIADFDRDDGVTALPLKIVTLLGPALAIVLAIELALNLLLELYRPRRPGEQPRAAFDSRLLALVASPGGAVASLGEALNYQFGFEVSRTWFYRLLARSFAWLIVGGAAALLLLSCVYVVEPHQRAVVTTFGELSPEPAGPGLHLKAPWPIGQVEKYDVSRLRTLVLGSAPPENEQRDAAAVREVQRTPYLYSPAPGQTDEAEPLLLGSARRDGGGGGEGAVGVSLGLAQFTIAYHIGDVVKYVVNNPYAEPGEPRDDAAEREDRLLSQLAQDALARVLMTSDFDRLAGGERPEIAAELRRRLQNEVAEYGYEIDWVAVTAVRPAAAVADVYTRPEQEAANRDAAVADARREAATRLIGEVGDVETARQIADLIERHTAADQAGDDAQAAELRAEAEVLIAGARGTASTLLSQARADKSEQVLGEQGRLARFRGDRAAFAAAPELYEARAVFEQLREVLPQTRLYLLLLDDEQRRELDQRFDMTAGRTGDFSLGSLGDN